MQFSLNKRNQYRSVIQVTKEGESDFSFTLPTFTIQFLRLQYLLYIYYINDDIRSSWPLTNSYCVDTRCIVNQQFNIIEIELN